MAEVEQAGAPKANSARASANALLLAGDEVGGDADLTIDDPVTVPQGRGTIRFFGPTSFSPGEWFGVELEEPNGKNDGSVRGVRYFDCPPAHGVFVRRSAMSRRQSDPNKTKDSDIAANSSKRPFSSRCATSEDESGAALSPMPRKANSHNRKKDANRGRAAKNDDGLHLGKEPSLPMASAQRELAEAAEEHDVERLRHAIPLAASSGVPSAELEAARHILNFECSRSLLDAVQEIKGAVAEMKQLGLTVQALGVSPEGDARGMAAQMSDERSSMERLLEDLREEVRQTNQDVRRSFAGFAQELRQDIADQRAKAMFERRMILQDLSGLRGDIGTTGTLLAAEQKGEASPSSPGRPKSPMPVVDGRDQEKAKAAAVEHCDVEEKMAERLLAAVKGGAERRERRKLEAAANVVQRNVRRLKNRWDSNALSNKHCSFHAVATAARSRNKYLASIFDGLREGNDGLTQETFCQGLKTAHPRLTVEQCEALFKGFSRGTSRTMMDFRGFNAICDAVATSDRAAAEFADMTVEDFVHMAYKPLKTKLNYVKNRGGNRERRQEEQEEGDGTPVAKQHSILQMQIDCPKVDIPDVVVYNMDLNQDGARRNIQLYYRICLESKGLLVTTSCFTIWRQHSKQNGHAKLIPAIPAGEGGGSQPSNVRVFFFDDNLDMEGSEDSPGICNLRDINTGDFVDFGDGKNGFRSEKAARHTLIHHSDRYQNVLVKANILDAIEDKEYFSKIIERCSEPGEKMIIFMDVNSTIVCNDTVQGKDLRGSLLGTMFDSLELAPHEAFDFVWDDQQPIRIEKPMQLRSLVKEITKADHLAYGAFWKEATCHRLVDELVVKGDLRWCLHEGSLTRDLFYELYRDYVAAIERDVSEEGIASSWFQCFDKVKAKHTIVLNSFGVDTRKVIIATGLNERKVLQIAANHDLWDARDAEKFAAQFQEASTPAK